MHLTRILGTALVFATVSSLPATTVSVNFTDNGSADSTMASSDIAGLPGSNTRVANWNNAHVNGAAGSLGGLVDQSGSLSGVSISWATDLGQWRLGHGVADGDDRMWKGYLDVQNNASVTVTGVPFVGTYDVYVYFDGDNGNAWRVANFAIGGIADGGEDSEDANWGVAGQENQNRLYQLPVPGGAGNQIWPVSPNNDEGNYVVLSGITGSSFTLTASGGPNANIPRAPINGFQIVGVIPEPGTAALGLLCLAALCGRRRTRR